MTPATATSERAYRALAECVGLLGGEDRSLLEVTGERPREIFDGLVTNRVRDLEPGRAVYAFMLTAKGRPVAEMRILARAEDRLWLDLPRACREGAEEHLGRYLPPRLARVRPLENRSRVSLVGPASTGVLEDLLAESLPGVPSRPAAGLEPLQALLAPAEGESDGALVAVGRERIEGPGFDLYLPGAKRPALLDAVVDAVERAGGAAVEDEVRQVWRVERGVPEYGAEIDEDVLPQETGQEDRAVDFEKGCYTGQEVVARIHFRGKVNRHLRGLRLPGDLDRLPAPGSELFADGRSRGHVTTAVRSPALGPIALGYVRRELAPGDALARAPEATRDVEVVDVPFPGSPFTTT
jgi:folate-binding protein YgfZ